MLACQTAPKKSQATKPKETILFARSMHIPARRFYFKIVSTDMADIEHEHQHRSKFFRTRT